MTNEADDNTKTDNSPPEKYEHTAIHNTRWLIQSATVNDRLALFLYLLMREHVPTGTLEIIVREVERIEPSAPVALEGVYMEGEARSMAKRIIGPGVLDGAIPLDGDDEYVTPEAVRDMLEQHTTKATEPDDLLKFVEARSKLGNCLIQAQRDGYKYGCTSCGRGLNVIEGGEVETCACQRDYDPSRRCD